MAQNTGPLGGAASPVPPQQPQAPQSGGATTQPTRDTGPLEAITGFFKGIGQWTPKAPKAPKMPKQVPAVQGPDTRSSIQKLRDTVAEFDEDYRNIGERFLGAFQQFAGYVVPFVIMLAVGNDLGEYFTPFYQGNAFAAYGISYGMEGAIAALTIALGRAFEHLGSGKAEGMKVGLTLFGWLLLNASSALALYAMAIGVPVALPAGASADTIANILQIHTFMLFTRTAAVASIDFGCALALMWKGRSLQKHIEAMRKKATSIGELADAERATEEADKNAELREQMMKATLKIQNDLSVKIGDAVSMVMNSILEKMEKSLKDDNQGNERGYGRR